MGNEPIPGVTVVRLRHGSGGRFFLLGCLLFARLILAQYPGTPQIVKDGAAVLLQNFASLPLSSRTTGNYPPPINFGGQLGRVNFLRSEPANTLLASTRFFANDLNRNFYILVATDNPITTNSFKIYINFEQVFPHFDNDPGYAGGLVTFAFDPEYATNGIFYTVHTETTNYLTAAPTNGALPGFNVTGYAVTAPINPPVSGTLRQAVLVEWRDTNINNITFEGTARELLRVGFNDVIHPMGDLIFNPLAHPGDSDYRNLYICNGDGAAGETPGAQHSTPQRLDALQGKILRITPDTNAHPADALSDNGRYRIPSTGADPNPFVSLSLAGLKKEIYAYGFRNPHRISWDTVSDKIIVNDIGLGSWEEANIIHKGTNYGYAEREGIEELFVCTSCGGLNGLTGGRVGISFPATDLLTVTNGPGSTMMVAPAYPVAAYSHQDGDAISSGFVYRGSLMPQLMGKYIFGDITTARLFYCDLAEMIAADDGNRTSLAVIRELQVVFDSPYDIPNKGVFKRRMFDIVSEEYHHKGGTANAITGGCGGLATGGNDPEGIPYGCGRADIRLGLGGDGEIYVLSKSDGMIRKMTAFIEPLWQEVAVSETAAVLNWSTVNGLKYRLQYKTNLNEAVWNDILPNVTASGTSARATNSFGVLSGRFYRVKLVP